MEAKIKEVQDYFKSKLVNGDYTPIEFTPNYVRVIVDGKFNFIIWIGNSAKYCRQWSYLDNQFMILTEFSESECVDCFNNVTRIIEANAEKVRLEKIEALKSELAKLETI